jgi:hypothetical protein
MIFNKIYEFNPINRWEVILKNQESWILAVYKPEYFSVTEINELEKHTKPELFICQAGEMGLLLFHKNKEETIILKPGQIILVNDYHNGFRNSSEGYFLVCENQKFTTDIIERETKIR